MDEQTREAIKCRLDIARGDTGQSPRLADFILAWWNAEQPGGFDLADVFAVDREIVSDMASVFAWPSGRADAKYPLDDRAQIEEIIRPWRTEVWARASGTA